jgi:uncharacterized protein (DUF2461 family)
MGATEIQAGALLVRVYRDIRFSHDKRPFKAHLGIRFHHSSGKDAHAPVFYLQRVNSQPKGIEVSADFRNDALG